MDGTGASEEWWREMRGARNWSGPRTARGSVGAGKGPSQGGRMRRQLGQHPPPPWAPRSSLGPQPEPLLSKALSSGAEPKPIPAPQDLPSSTGPEPRPPPHQRLAPNPHSQGLFLRGIFVFNFYSCCGGGISPYCCCFIYIFIF